MKWYDNLYLGDSVEKKADKIKRKISHGMGLDSLCTYVISFASNPDNLLDIIPARELRQKAYPKDRLRIIGLAGSRQEALKVVQRIIEETYQNTGDVDLYQYLKENRRQEA